MGNILALVILVLILLVACGWAFADNAIIYQTIAREASGEPLTAQAMVAKVIQTRADERNLSFKKVCLEPKQFSCWNEGVKQKPRTEEEIRNAVIAWEMARRMDEKVNLYHDISVNPYRSIHSDVNFIKQIGRLRFYHEVR